MRLSEKYPVPRELALLYEFANSIDLRRFVENGTTHVTGDELETAPEMEHWMRARKLLAPHAHITAAQHRKALELRDALRAFLRLSPEQRGSKDDSIVLLNRLSDHYPLVLKFADNAVKLQPAQGSSGFGNILAEIYLLAETGRLDRLKVCGSDECNWVFYDRSKPGKRRWCSSTLCGNRQKTRAYRQRRREATPSPQ